VNGSRIAEIVSRAGTFGRRIVPPDVAQRDAFAGNSYWWLSKDLTDKVEVDWAKRNPIVRAEFDLLEDEFATGIPMLTKKAAALRQAGKPREAAALLDQYSASCLEKAVQKIQDLRRRFENVTEKAGR